MSAAQVVSHLTEQVHELHSRCNALRRRLGHPLQPSDNIVTLKQQHSRPEAALLQLRDAKASELQLLALRCCGHSTRQCHGGNAAPKQAGDRFNLALMLAVADCMSQQAAELSGYAQRHEALVRENRTLRELAGPRAKSVPPAASSAAGAAGAAGARPASASAAARAPPQRPPPAFTTRPPPPMPDAAGVPDDMSDVSSIASGRTDRATAAATTLLGGRVISGSGGDSSCSCRANAASAHTRHPPVREAFGDPGGAELPAHRAPPSLKPAGGLVGRTEPKSLVSSIGHPPPPMSNQLGGVSDHQRMLSLRRRLDEAVAENALWKRQFAIRLDQKLAEMRDELGRAEAGAEAAKGGAAARPASAPPPAPPQQAPVPPPSVPPPVTAKATVDAKKAAEKVGENAAEKAAKVAAAKADAAKADAAKAAAAKAEAALKEQKAALDLALSRASAAEASSSRDRAALAALKQELTGALAAAKAAEGVSAAAEKRVAAAEHAAKSASSAKAAASAEAKDSSAAKLAAATERVAKLEAKLEAAAKTAAESTKAEARAALDDAVAAERSQAAKREEKLGADLSSAKREIARLGTEVKKAREGSSTEVDDLRAQIGAAERRVAEVETQSQKESAKREASARHELALEKTAASQARAELQSRLDAALARQTQLETQLGDSRAGSLAATERAESAEAHAARLHEASEGRRVRADAAEREAREHARRANEWKDERAALQSELHASRRHVELERQHKAALEESVSSERTLLRSIQVLLESRLGELATQSNAADLAQGAEALQVLMGRAAATQSALEGREALLSDTLALVTTRHADRLEAVEQAAEQRSQCAAALERLESVLRQIEGNGNGSHDVDVEEIRTVSELLRTAKRADSAASAVLGRQEKTLGESLVTLGERNGALQAELTEAHAQIATLRTSKPASTPTPPVAKPVARPPPSVSIGGLPASTVTAHRAPPAREPRKLPEDNEAALNKYDSAEYKASAPHPPAEARRRLPAR